MKLTSTRITTSVVASAALAGGMLAIGTAPRQPASHSPASRPWDVQRRPPATARRPQPPRLPRLPPEICAFGSSHLGSPRPQRACCPGT